MNREHLKIPIQYGEASLIGRGRERPTKWGNYFWLQYEGTSYRVLNMWLENLEDADIRFNLGGEVEVHLVKEDDHRRFIIIDDERIPNDWYYQKLYFTGYYCCSYETAKWYYELKGDPDHELESWTDIKSYYSRRGWNYNEKTGLVEKKINTVEKARGTWTVEMAKNLKSQHGVDLEKEVARLLTEQIKDSQS